MHRANAILAFALFFCYVFCYDKVMPKVCWFKEGGVCYKPISWQGWLACILYASAVAVTFWYAAKNSHSVSDTLIKSSIPFIILSLIFIYISRVRLERQ